MVSARRQSCVLPTDETGTERRAYWTGCTLAGFCSSARSGCPSADSGLLTILPERLRLFHSECVGSATGPGCARLNTHLLYDSLTCCCSH